MSLSDLLGRTIAGLDHAAIPHMVAGSFASSYHGHGRSTQDLDLVVDPSPATLDAWLASVDLGTGYVDAEVARDALRRRGQFNLIDFATAWKVDLIVRKDRPFSRSEFDRRVAATIAGVAVYVVSAEDTILSKLEWARQGGSERQLRDVRGVLEVMQGRLDLPYLEHWVRVLGVEDGWAQVGPA